MTFALRLRSTETVVLEVPEAHTLAEIDEGLRRQVPDGFELFDIRVSQPRSTNHMVGAGIARKLEYREITGDSSAALLAAVPEGWQAQSIREV